jgi:EAL and modified HD-GYP domain-containing signal transduction protein
MDCNYLISRQPIFGSNINLAAYELRSCPIVVTEDGSSSGSAERALFTMFTGSSLDQIVGTSDCFIRLTSDGIAEGLWKLTPKSRVVFGLLEAFGPSDPAAQGALALIEEGYRLTVSDQLCSESLDLLGNRAHAIQVDAIGYAPSALEQRVQELRRYNTKLLAANVDTYDDLEFCRSLGFDFYQGRFVSRSASQSKEVPVNRLTLMRVLAQLQQPDIPMPDLEKIISQDLSLSLKVLRYSNSGAVALPRKVASVGHAVRLLGMDMLRNWARVLLLSAVEDKPRELMTIALIRARMCERLSESLRNAQKESFFSAGLLSVLDALLDCPMEKAVAELPLVDEVREALTKRAGPIGQALRCTIAYERADWDDVQFYGLPPLPIRDIYMEAISWTQELTSGLLS